MIADLRRQFNSAYTPDKYQRFLAILEQRVGVPTAFRLSETPVFLPRDLVRRMSQYGREMVETLLADPQYRAESERAIPDRWRVPHESDRPLFIQVDFGLDEALEPKLVEIQGFPSLYAYQPELAASYAEAYSIDLPSLPGGLTEHTYRDLLRKAVLGDHDPAEVVLMEIDPVHQKTLPDFLMTEKVCGIRTVDISAIYKRGNRLYHGNDIPIRRIYNRAIVDELERKQVPLQVDFRDDLDVEWAGHPNWFFRLSKFSLPYLKHPSVPKTLFLRDAASVDNPDQWVLKPLFSFAGLGVIVGPTHDQIAAAPKDDCVLQQRIDFRPVIDTPYGMTKMEVRIMYLWLDRLRAVNTIIRTGRGAQMGVDHNKGMEWVGASAAFIAG